MLDVRKRYFTMRVVRLEQVAQRSCRCLIIASAQGQVGWGLEQHDVVEGVPDHNRIVYWM